MKDFFSRLWFRIRKKPNKKVERNLMIDEKEFLITQIMACLGYKKICSKKKDILKFEDGNIIVWINFKNRRVTKETKFPYTMILAEYYF